MFFGISAALTPRSGSVTPSLVTTLDRIEMTGMVLDAMYATRKILSDFDWQLPDAWDYDTYLLAEYKGTTQAGNVAFTENATSKVKIKKRFKGDFDWKTIYEKEVNTVEDFEIEFYDYYEPSNRDIEYSYVPVINNVDQEAAVTTVRSEFYSYFLCGRNENYPMIMDTTNAITLNRENTMVTSPGRKYPYVNYKGITKYYSGVVNATFIEIKQPCYVDVENGWSYRNRVDEFLTNGMPKILKSFEGDIWMVNIVDTIPRTENEWYQNVSTQFNWVECGNPLLIADLYDNGFIDTDTDREQVT